MAHDTSAPLARRLEIAAAGFLPGALLGTQVAGLLFFLNPHLPFAFWPVARGVALYGLGLGTIGLLLHLPLTWGRRRRARRLLPWSLTLVLGAAALSAWIHASTYAFYLPAGINRRLLKLGILLTISMLVAFYTALVHELQRRRYGVRSKILLTIVALTSIYIAVERREAFRPTPQRAPRATTIEAGQRPRLVVVGVESATLDAVLPLAEMGRLPFFSRLRQEGAVGRLNALYPNRRGPAWTTLAVGAFPFQHGIVDDRLYGAPFVGGDAFLSLLPLGVGFERWGARPLPRPVDAELKRALSLWEILSRLGVSTGVIGWPLTSPVPPRVAVCLSEAFFAGSDLPRDRTPVELGARANLFRTRTDELDPALVARFGSRPPALVLESLASDVWRQTLSAFLLEQEPRHEALFLHLPGLAPVSERYFGAHAAVHFAGDQTPRVAQAAQLLAAYYSHLDAFLARLWEQLPEPRLLIVVSAHGVETARGWQRLRGAITGQPVFEGDTSRAPQGLLMALGTGIQPGTMIGEAQLVDVAPTLLYGLGFPVAQSLDGVVLTRIFDTAFLGRHPLIFVPSYQTLPP